MDPFSLMMIASAIGGGTSLLGGAMSQKNSNAMAYQNMLMQQQFAQKGLQWRAADATAAQDATGINRLALLGAPTASFSNVAGDNSLGAGVSAMGQNISRSLMAVADKNDQLTELEMAEKRAKIANMNADTTQMLAEASKTAVAKQPGSGPGLGLYDANGNVIKSIPMATTQVRTKDGEIIEVPTKDVSAQTQTLAAAPSSVVLAADLFRQGFRHWNTELLKHQRNIPVVRPDFYRGVSPDYGAMY